MAATNKNNLRQYVQCASCKKAKARLQWFKNPLIVVCGENDERQVGMTNRLCKSYVFAEESELPPLQHFDSYDNS